MPHPFADRPGGRPTVQAVPMTLPVAAVDRLLSLDAAAQATGQSVARLRGWCATGRLRCEREGRAWIVPLSEVVRIAVLVEEHDRAVAAGAAAALVVPMTAATLDLPAEIARRLGLAVEAVTTSTLALDGSEYVLAVWKTNATPGLEALSVLAAELGGELLDGQVRPVDSASGVRSATPFVSSE